MAGWEISRHPEWDLMYAAGLTAREISDLCHQNIATVHLHLRKREDYTPGFQAKHEATLAARGPNRPTAKWRKRAKEALDFYSENKRLPQRNGGHDERSLFAWISEQRRQFNNGLLPKIKIAALQDLDNWKVNPWQQELDKKWERKLIFAIEFTNSQKRLPRYRGYSSDHERTLGVWLHNQNQRESLGKLELRRVQELNTKLPTWRNRK
ncbi:helicase associated domain-containing protein [Arthrobacter sp. MYb222]|uniref:helicase associated domain-containing protein n=1 Tax=Arthrobacter sp. MYb222 TaxID=1848599 RepID=UPI000CFB9A0E|nr:helicase associated domain-containing protein [Arthrobacter sp. MYb222]PQZ83729.1 hypothetical protein CQ016_16630 [Arthrobacter sp. MYb222]